MIMAGSGDVSPAQAASAESRLTAGYLK